MKTNTHTKRTWSAAMFILAIALASVLTSSALALSEESEAADARAQADELYRSGRDALDARDWTRAVELFRRVETSGENADAALYWIAYAQHQSGRGEQAKRTLERLRDKHPESRWMDDAEALLVELAGARGRSVDPNVFDGDELKLLALNSLMNADSERALDLLEGLLEGDHSARLKERALFVLSQNSSPRASKLLAKIATGGSHRELQVEAVRMLGISGRNQDMDLLQQVYGDSKDPAVRRAVLQSFMVAGDSERLVAAARSEPNHDLRMEAIRLVGASGKTELLADLWSSEQPKAIRGAILEAFMIANDHDQLIEVAFSETDPELRRRAVELLGVVGGDEASAALGRLYRENTDSATREAVLQSWMVSNDVESLLQTARTEKNPRLKRKAVEMLSIMDEPEARAYMLELLEQ